MNGRKFSPSLAILLAVLLLKFNVAHGGVCDNVAPIANSWAGGITYQALNIPITTTISQWTLVVTFSAPISSLSPWGASSKTSDKTNFQLSNLSYNGQQSAGTTYTGVGFNVAYPSTNAMPTITRVLFNGVNICSGNTATTTTTKATTTAAATTKPATTPTTKATSTAAATTKPATTTTTKAATTTAATITPAATTATPVSTGCGSIAVVTTSWPGGMGVNLNIPFRTSVTSWTLDITFSAAISSLSVWNVVSSTSNNIVFRLSSMSYNGQQSAGTVYTGAGFNVAYPSTNPAPSIISMALNGVNICSGTGPIATTTSASGSTSASTATSPTTTATTSTGTTTTTTPSPNPTNTTKYNYADVITKSLLFYDAQRSGRLPANNPIPYRGDSALGDKGANNEDLTGGYYDAGDFVKFGFPMAYTITVVAWGVVDWTSGYSAAGQLANAQDMIKWGTDYFLKCLITSGGVTQRFYGQVGDGNADHAYWGRPEDMTMSRPAFYLSPTSPGSDLAGETAAALAAASIVFSSVNATYSAQLLTAAKALYIFANQYRGTYQSSISNAGSFYSSSGYGDELAWAAIWLYRATNTASYLTDAQNHYSSFGLSYTPGSFSWDDKTVGVQVLLAKATGNSAYTTATQAFCNNQISSVPKTPKGLVFISIWGSLRYAANSAMICLMAGDLNINPIANRKFAQNQIHYMLGDTGRSFVCGFGVNPPVSPHHRSSSCPNRPATCDWNTYNSPGPNGQTLWGALIGGPDASDNYVDARSNYQQNEVACDYNAGFQSAVAGLLKMAVQGIVP